MDAKEYQALLESIKQTAARIFESAETEEEVCQLEDMINREIMYAAAIAQSDRVMPPEGWDPIGR